MRCPRRLWWLRQHHDTTVAAPTSNPLNKASFISQADAICKAGKDKLKPQQAAVTAAATAEQTNDTAANRQALEGALSNYLSLASPVLGQLRALESPTADRVVVAKYVSGVANQISLFRQLVTAAENNGVSSGHRVSQQLGQGRASIDRVAQGYGFKVCGARA